MGISFPTRKLIYGAVCLVGLVVILSIFFFGRTASDSNNGTPEAAPAPVIEVTTETAVGRSMPAYLQVTGSFAADESSDVAPEVSGQVVATPVDVGAFVQRGAVLVRLNDRDARLRLEQALAAERQAESAAQQARERLGLRGGADFDVNAIPEVQAALRQFEAAESQALLAEANARRYAALVETGDVSRMTYDQARAQAESARAQANAARQNYQLAINVARQNNVGIAAAEAQVQGARSQVALARKALADTVITAPFAGFVSDRPVAAGEYVTPASKIATLLKTDPIKLRLQVPELDAASIRLGQAVEATVDAFPESRFQGKVTAINPAIEQASRAVVVEVAIDNAGGQLRPGMFATARIMESEAVEGVFVPRAAILEDPDTSSFRVFVIEGETARLRIVQPGDREGDMVRIISGVAAGEVVATSNLDQLYEGATVARR